MAVEQVVRLTSDVANYIRGLACAHLRGQVTHLCRRPWIFQRRWSLCQRPMRQRGLVIIVQMRHDLPADRCSCGVLGMHG